MSFILNMAWRDSRRNRGRLLLFVSAIVAGIAALTAVRSFSDNLTKDIDHEAKSLLGADLLIEGNQDLPDSILQQLMATPGIQKARVFNLMSMVYFPKSGGTRLAMVRASEPGFPYFGTWKSDPADSWKTFQDGKRALLENSLMLQFDVHTGDTIRIGRQSFPVHGNLLSRPGRASIGSSIAPVALIPFNWLDSTGLVQRGSRIWYQYYFKIPDAASIDPLVKKLEKPLKSANLNWETVASNKESIGNAFGNVATFLNLVGFIALLLGCIGVAGAVHLYIRDKLPTVAILRCLGASGRKAFYVYLSQVFGIALLGSLAGVVIGSLLQKALPWVGRDFLPVEQVSTDISWPAVGQGLLLGIIVSVLFALLPLSTILQTSPLRTLRGAFDEPGSGANRKLRWGIYSLIFLTLAGFTWWLTGNWKQAAGFLGGIAVAFAVLWGAASLLMYLLRRFFPKGWSYTVRQGIANLFRPQNQTVLLVVTIGLGTMLLSVLFLTQNLLLRQVAFAGSGSQPNMILFDIQTSEKDSVAAMVRAHGLPVMQQVPIVTARLENIDGRIKSQDEADSTTALPGWVWDHEYRVTFRDTLISSEKITDGAWVGTYEPGSGPVKVSISDNLQRAMKAKIGTKLLFNVQGARMETEVASVRKVDFQRMQTNFLVVFPKGVLENAPQFHVIVSRVDNAAQSAALQTDLVRRFPSVSAIDITQVLKSVDEVLGKVSFVIRFMALFSILTGLLVLLSSIYQSKFARVRESVLLRTLGASRRQIRWINAMEYFLLGALSCLVGIGLSVLGAWALAEFSFHIPFEVEWLPLVLIFMVITGLTLALGLLNSREVVRKPPLEVLRAEVG